MSLPVIFRSGYPLVETMRISIAVLLALAFFQAVFLPVDLVGLVLVVRFLITDDDLNIYLAFGLGLLVSFLANLPLGSLSLFYLVALALVNMVKKVDFFSHWSLSLPIVLLALFAESLLRNFLSGAGIFSGFVFLWWFLSALLILPAYFLVRFWEERFIPQKELRLKLKD